MTVHHPLALDATALLEVLHTGTGATLSVIDRDGYFRYVNAGFARALKMPAAEAVGRTVLECYGEETAKLIEPLFAKVLAGETVAYERKGRIHEDADAWISVTMSPWRAPSGEVLGVVTTTLRVHELRVATEKLVAATQRLASHVENSPLTVIELDDALAVIRCSARAATMLGYDPEALTGKNIADALGEGADAEMLLSSLRQLQRGDVARTQVEAPFVKPSGEITQLAWFLSSLRATSDQSLTVMCLIEDVSAKRLAEQQLRHLATHDPLTGLFNRSGLDERVNEILQRGSNAELHLSCLFIDLDGFKKVNDEHGHAAGDAVLIETARRLSRLLNAEDIAARVGGDEFVLVLSDGPNNQRAAQLTAAILDALRAPCVFTLNEQHISAVVGASVGVSSQSSRPINVTELIKHADAAMYQVKRAGKDRRKAPARE